jgi:hypothetical protein
MRDERVGLYRKICADVALEKDEAGEVFLVADNNGQLGSNHAQAMR